MNLVLGNHSAPERAAKERCQREDTQSQSGNREKICTHSAIPRGLLREHNAGRFENTAFKSAELRKFRRRRKLALARNPRDRILLVSRLAHLSRWPDSRQPRRRRLAPQNRLAPNDRNLQRLRVPRS